MLQMPDGANLAREMNENLPLFCYSNKRNTKALAAQGLTLSEHTELEVARVFDLLEAGGVMCELKTGSEQPLIMSLSGLDFKNNGLIDDKIAEYKSARIEWVKQEERLDKEQGRQERIKVIGSPGESVKQKPSRNAPCPCGSGKKYKKCCFGKDDATTVEREREGIAEAEEREGDEEFQEMMLMAMSNWRRRTLEQKPHIKAYKQIRKMHGEIGRSMMDYYDEGKFEQAVDPDYVSPHAGKNSAPKMRELILYEAEFDPDTREGIQGLVESVIYKTAPNINCITEDFIKKNRYRKPEKIEMLQSMLNSRSGLFEVTAIDTEDGYAFLREVFTGDEYKITDTGISANKNHDEICLYTRIITYQGISFGTGLSLMFEKTDPFIISFIKREQKKYMPHAEYTRFIELYNRFTKHPSKYKIVAHSF